MRALIKEAGQELDGRRDQSNEITRLAGRPGIHSIARTLKYVLETSTVRLGDHDPWSKVFWR